MRKKGIWQMRFFFTWNISVTFINESILRFYNLRNFHDNTKVKYILFVSQMKIMITRNERTLTFRPKNIHFDLTKSI